MNELNIPYILNNQEHVFIARTITRLIKKKVEFNCLIGIELLDDFPIRCSVMCFVC